MWDYALFLILFAISEAFINTKNLFILLQSYGMNSSCESSKIMNYCSENPHYFLN